MPFTSAYLVRVVLLSLVIPESAAVILFALGARPSALGAAIGGLAAIPVVGLGLALRWLRLRLSRLFGLEARGFGGTGYRGARSIDDTQQ